MANQSVNTVPRTGEAPQQTKVEMKLDPIEFLSFVGKSTKKEIKGGAFPRNFWMPPKPMDYATECIIGSAYAVEALNFMREHEFPPFLGWCAESMIRKGSADGYVVGFFHEISMRLNDGKTRAAIKGDA